MIHYTVYYPESGKKQKKTVYMRQQADYHTAKGADVVAFGSGADDYDVLDAVKDLVTENGRHSFDIRMLMKDPLMRLEKRSDVKRALYRLHESGHVCINPYPPDIEESDRITSFALDINVPV